MFDRRPSDSDIFIIRIAHVHQNRLIRVQEFNKSETLRDCVFGAHICKGGKHHTQQKPRTNPAHSRQNPQTPDLQIKERRSFRRVRVQQKQWNTHSSAQSCIIDGILHGVVQLWAQTTKTDKKIGFQLFLPRTTPSFGFSLLPWASHSCFLIHAFQTSGYGLTFNHQDTAGFSPCFHFGYIFFDPQPSWISEGFLEIIRRTGNTDK